MFCVCSHLLYSYPLIPKLLRSHNHVIFSSPLTSLCEVSCTFLYSWCVYWLSNKYVWINCPQLLVLINKHKFPGKSTKYKMKKRRRGYQVLISTQMYSFSFVLLVSCWLGNEVWFCCIAFLEALASFRVLSRPICNWVSPEILWEFTSYLLEAWQCSKISSWSNLLLQLLGDLANPKYIVKHKAMWSTWFHIWEFLLTTWGLLK